MTSFLDPRFLTGAKPQSFTPASAPPAPSLPSMLPAVPARPSFRAELPNILAALGAGIASNNMATGIQMLNDRRGSGGAGKNPTDIQKARTLAQYLRAKGDNVRADGVEAGYLSPEDAFKDHLDSQGETGKGAKRDIEKDSYGVPRYVDTGETVFPGDKAEEIVDMERADAKRAERQSAVDIRTDRFLNEAMDLVENDMTGASGRIGGTGLASWLSRVPTTDANILKNTLDPLKATVSFEELQAMRDASKTGGALGQVSNFENELLQQVQGSLNQELPPDVLAENLAVIWKLRKDIADGVIDPGTGKRVTVTQLGRRYGDMLDGKAALKEFQQYRATKKGPIADLNAKTDEPSVTNDPPASSGQTKSGLKWSLTR